MVVARLNEFSHIVCLQRSLVDSKCSTVTTIIVIFIVLSRGVRTMWNTVFLQNPLTCEHVTLHDKGNLGFADGIKVAVCPLGWED